MQSAALRKTVYYSYGVQGHQGQVEEEPDHSYENTIEVNKDDVVEEQVILENSLKESTKYVLIPSTQMLFNEEAATFSSNRHETRE